MAMMTENYAVSFNPPRRLQLDVLVAVSGKGDVVEGPIEASCIALNPKVQTTLRART